ncbi:MULTISPECIES: class I SAM-dependent methyltransferase [Bosea]|uniref:class I SAM-dependent DNA methyltransferase n=1 Tax=Bosea TaxID=85413 RepID=UPI00214FCC9A|nr:MULTISPECIES: class I SAM-dependent methyltransferase [Bosea]MCR4522039.1 class I SAM-dependent methyltransferase [Bosea sp. 47.2.35]MDR6829483.1 SAM-dependent methyltransferase [Bosea robiniae]MDR6896366.1 SAM-dependent methyltransferase [Bosea sp. BE109]MDR7139764.1 SAM-dependent methyltransferase [Bosea sp. BE168]MDR7176514.1 SAM-dependent methyltransferase [Bosea sp. BE271]
MTSPADAIIDLYQRHAATYDGLRGKLLMEGPWLARFRALLAPGATVLDIGCGTGQPIARHLREQGHVVTGVDSAPAMIALCRARFPEGDWQVADMRKLALGRRFGGLIAWDSFFHLTPEDQCGMFKIFAAHAAPGAALLFTSGPAHGEAIGTFEGEALYHGSLAPGEYRTLLAENGFAEIDHVVEDPSCGGHTIWLAQAGPAPGAL